MKQLIERICAIVDSENVLVDEPRSAHPTVRVGGPADCFVMPRTIDERALRRAVVMAEVLGKPRALRKF